MTPRPLLAPTGAPPAPPGAVDLADSAAFVGGVPHDYFAWLRANDPVRFVEEADGPGFWAVTRHADCLVVNRDHERFSSYRRGTMPFEIPDEAVEEQRLMMLNMDPPLHTRYRRLVNKGFTPRMVAELHDRIHTVTDDILDVAIERGEADFVTDIAAQLPLVVIAELLGVPAQERDQMFSWSNRLVGSEDPEYHVTPEDAVQAAMDLYGYASRLFAQKRVDPHTDLMSVLAQVEVDGERLSDLELELFFLLLTIAGNETTRNLVSGAMVAFFDHPEQWRRLCADRSLLPSAVEEMLRFVSPVMCFRRQTTCPVELSGRTVDPDQKVVFFHVSANRDDDVFADPQRFDIGRHPNPHMAFGGGGPHFCLGANLARMEIRVMFEHLLDRVPDIEQAGPPERLQSRFINGVKHLPVRFPAASRRGAA